MTKRLLPSGTIKAKLFFFSLILLLIVLVGGSSAFLVAMRQIVTASIEQDLTNQAEIQRIKLETSVNSEIAIALKMAGSPIIQQHFLDPENEELRRLATAEITGYRRAFSSNSAFWISDVDKRFYSDDAPPFVIDTDSPDNYWYYMTLYETAVYNFNINYNPDLNVLNLWINAPVFYENKPIGMLGTGIDITVFINSIISNYSGKADLYLFNNLGEITGAYNADLVANKVTLDQELKSSGAAILQQARNIRRDESIILNGREGKIVVGGIPVLGWYIALVHPITRADYLSNNISILFAVMLLVIVVIIIIFNVVVSSSTKPLYAMMDILNEIAADWNITRRLQIKTNDEIGSLGAFFNNTFDKMGALIRAIKNRAFTLSDTAQELAAYMLETGKAINDINTAKETMKDIVNSETEEMRVTTEYIDRIINGLGNLNQHIEIQADSVSQSSSAIEEMLANIRSVTETLIKNTNNINSLADSSEAGRVDLEKVSSDIQEIARESAGLLEINSVMENIASQTNLLSMNAAIEAAHAGESGKGFAVVASEIRKLAENSSQQSQTISGVLQKITASINTMTKSTTAVLERFKTIEKDVKTVSNQELQIRSAMEEQEIGSRHILDAISQLNSITSQVKNSSASMNKESMEIMAENKKLLRITEELANSMEKMTASIEEIYSAISRVNEISQENEENITVLSSELSQLTVE